MNRKTISLAILVATSIALALGTLAPSRAFAQSCGKDKDGNPIECEPGGRDKKASPTTIPPTATDTPTPVPTATAAPTGTSTIAAPAAAIVPLAPVPEQDKPQPRGWWLPAAAVLLLIGVIAAARRALRRPRSFRNDLDGQLDLTPEFEFRREDVRATFSRGQVSTTVPTKTPGRVGVTPEIPEVPGISTTGASLFLPGGAPVRANMTSEYPEHRPTRSPRKGVPTKSTPSQGSTDASEKGTDDSSASDDEADDK